MKLILRPVGKITFYGLDNIWENMVKWAAHLQGE